MLKLGEMNSKSIVKGILIIGITYLVILFLTRISEWYLVSWRMSNFKAVFNYIMTIISTLANPILCICLLKLICEILYKVLMVLDIKINKNIK